MNQLLYTANNIQKNRLNANLNYRNIQINQVRNQNSNPSNNINNNENDELGKAFFLIRRELKMKDNKISELEKKVMELTKKLNLLTNNKNSDFYNS